MNLSKRILVFLILLSWPSFLITPVLAVTTPNMDTDFNASGFVTHHGAAGGNGNDSGVSLTIDANGKYVVGGSSTNASGNLDMTLWRYNSNGTLDTTFNGVGFVSHHGAAGGNGNDAGASLAIDANGKYVVSGNSANASGNADITLWRYNANGTLDTTFNGVGFVSHHGAAGGSGHDGGLSLAIDANGKYVVGGYSANASGNNDVTLWRYNSNGTLDTTFNGVGFVTHHGAAGGNGHDAGASLAIDDNGKYVVSGYSVNASGNFDTTLWRYNANGTLDTTFNGVGFASHHGAAGGSGNDSGVSLTIDSSGKYLVGGYSPNALGNNDVTLWRYNSNGTLDTSFSGDGIYTNNFSTSGNLNDTIYGYSALAVDENHAITIVGYLKRDFANADLLVIRLTDAGVLDTTFNGEGYVYYPRSNGDDIPYSLASDGRGKYVMSGYSTGGNQDMALWVVLDFPHTISLSRSSSTLTGTVSAPKSTTTIQSVSWSLARTGGTWTSCSAIDGSFDSLSENYTCDTSSLSGGEEHTFFVRACNQYGACTYLSEIQSTNAPRQEASTSPSTTEVIYQIPESSGGNAFSGPLTPMVDSDTGLQRVVSVIEPQTFSFNAYLSAKVTSAVPKILGGGTPIGKVQEIWYKAYPPRGTTLSAANIIPELQQKPSIVSLSYSETDLTSTNPKTLRLAYSADGKNWKLLKGSVVDPVNHTVSVIQKVGGFYTIVATKGTTKSTPKPRPIRACVLNRCW